MPSSVLSSDSMHLGLLAAASHAAATISRFTIFFNPRCEISLNGWIGILDLLLVFSLHVLTPKIGLLIRASPSEFVIPLTKYVKAVYHTRVSVGMRFRMLFETEESSVRR